MENFICKYFSHKFTTISDEKITPVSAKDINDMLLSLKNNCIYVDVEKEIIRGIQTSIVERTNTKTFCKRCGKVI